MMFMLLSSPYVQNMILVTYLQGHVVRVVGTGEQGSSAVLRLVSDAGGAGGCGKMMPGAG